MSESKNQLQQLQVPLAKNSISSDRVSSIENSVHLNKLCEFIAWSEKVEQQKQRTSVETSKLPKLPVNFSIQHSKNRERRLRARKQLHSNNAMTLDRYLGEQSLSQQDTLQHTLPSKDEVMRKLVLRKDSIGISDLDYTQFLLGFQVRQLKAQIRDRSKPQDPALDRFKRFEHQKIKKELKRACEGFTAAKVIAIPLNRSPLPDVKDRTQLKESGLVRREYYSEVKQIDRPWQFSPETTVFQMKMRRFHDFLFKVNFTYGLRYDPALKPPAPKFHFRVFIGRGNNSELVKAIVKRRHWWKIVDNKSSAHFVWTQLKLNDYFQLQSPSTHVLPPNSLRICLAKRKEKKQQWPYKYQPIPQNQRIFNREDSAVFFHIERQLRDKLDNFALRQRVGKRSLVKLQWQALDLQKLQNHLPANSLLGNKKALLYNLRRMYEAKGIDQGSRIPLTFHIKSIKDKQFTQFQKRHRQIRSSFSGKSRPRNIWIVKPGENSNRGTGIKVISEVSELRHIVERRERHQNGKLKTYIVQKYIERPLLYHRRKFDIRHYMLASCIHGVLKGYWYADGYIRTSCQQFSVSNLGDSMIHLTNDAIQKNSESYGKYQPANKLSYAQFQKYLDTHYDRKCNFFIDIYPVMKDIAREALESTALRLDPRRLAHNFQLFGLDYMITEDFKPLLIEVNTNPCLELACPLLGNIIPSLLENTFRLVVDPLFPPVVDYLNTQQHNAPDHILKNMKFELFFECSGFQEGGSEDLLRVRQWEQRARAFELEEIEDDNQEYQDDGEKVNLQSLIQQD